jgi:hypothetical protein
MRSREVPESISHEFFAYINRAKNSRIPVPLFFTPVLFLLHKLLSNHDSDFILFTSPLSLFLVLIIEL